jgi:hypothetical protein
LSLFRLKKFFSSTLGHYITLHSHNSFSIYIGAVRFKHGPLTIILSIYCDNLFLFLVVMSDLTGKAMTGEKNLHFRPIPNIHGEKFSLPPKFVDHDTHT